MQLWRELGQLLIGERGGLDPCVGVDSHWLFLLVLFFGSVWYVFAAVVGVVQWWHLWYRVLVEVLLCDDRLW